MNSSILDSKKRVRKALDGNFQTHHLTLSRSNKFLRKQDSERLPMFVLYVDLVGSTKMSTDLSLDTLNVITRIFSQEMSYVVEVFGVYVLKFVGDAILAYFLDKEKPSKIANDVVECARTMHQVIDDVLNPERDNDEFLKLQIKMTMDFSHCSISKIQCG